SHAPVHGSTPARAQEAGGVRGSLVTGADPHHNDSCIRRSSRARREGRVDLAGVPDAAGTAPTLRASRLPAARSLRIRLCRDRYDAEQERNGLSPLLQPGEAPSACASPTLWRLSRNPPAVAQ